MTIAYGILGCCVILFIHREHPRLMEGFGLSIRRQYIFFPNRLYTPQASTSFLSRISYIGMPLAHNWARPNSNFLLGVGDYQKNHVFIFQDSFVMLQRLNPRFVSLSELQMQWGQSSITRSLSDRAEFFMVMTPMSCKLFVCEEKLPEPYIRPKTWY